MIEEKMRIGGEKVTGENGSLDVLNPFNGEKVGSVPRASSSQVEKAMRIAQEFKPNLTRYERQQILSKTAEILVSRREEISDLITAESGLSKKDSLYEVGRAFDVFSLTGQLCILDDGQIFSCDLTPHGQKRKIFTQREPLQGVISAITPFNHPLNMVAHKIAPSIATNNRMVCKPTEKTPLTALLLADVLYEAGMPPEMFQVITGFPQDIGDAMITHPNIDLITFTGSVSVGKYIAEKAGYRRTVLELGGNAPLIIMEDADLDRASTLAVAGATKNSGQRCTAVKRILAIESIADELVEKIVQKASKLNCSDPSNPQTDVGTVIDENMGDELRVTVVATGLGHHAEMERSPRIADEIKRKVAGDGVPDYSEFDRPTVIRNAVVNGTDEIDLQSDKDLEYLDVPAFLRKQAD